MTLAMRMGTPTSLPKLGREGHVLVRQAQRERGWIEHSGEELVDQPVIGPIVAEIIRAQGCKQPDRIRPCPDPMVNTSTSSLVRGRAIVDKLGNRRRPDRSDVHGSDRFDDWLEACRGSGIATYPLRPYPLQGSHGCSADGCIQELAAALRIGGFNAAHRRRQIR
jgi:hypothetical protein